MFTRPPYVSVHLNLILTHCPFEAELTLDAAGAIASNIVIMRVHNLDDGRGQKHLACHDSTADTF